MVIVLNSVVSKCKDCLWLTNSSQLHDDAFTCAPYPIKDYCGKKEEPMLLFDTNNISKDCPYLNK